jgi:type IV pilus assembly protein PilM
MIPWNPIHRYAGMTSLFDSVDEQPRRDMTVARWDAAPQPSLPERAPLGFIDVRSEAGDHADEPSSYPFADEPETIPSETIPMAPPVELIAILDSKPEAEEKLPFYKREISFGRKKAEKIDAVAPADGIPAEIEEETVEPAGKVSFYKRELSFRREVVAPEEAADEIAFEPVAVDSTSEPDVDFAEEAREPAAVELESEPLPATQASEPEAISVDDPLEDLEIVEDDDAVFAADHVDSDVTEETSEPVVELEPPQELDSTEQIPGAPSNVPLHRRELFGKKNGKQPSSQKKGRGGGNRRPGRKIVGLKIGASQLAAAVVQESDGRHELLELARTPLEPGIVLDGEVRDGDALVSALRAFFADQKLPTRDVRIGVASNRIGVRTFEIAGIDDESRFDNAVRFKAHEVLPIAVSDSVLDYRVLEERMSESGEPIRRILLVVAPRDQVAPYVDVAQRAGLKLAGIDLEALGLLRAFVEPGIERTAGGTSTVVVSIGHEASTLLVSGGGACEFTRVFDWGGATLQEAISQELQVHPAEAATILRHLSLEGNSRRVEGIDEAAKNRAIDAVRLRLTPFARELVSSLQFYQTQSDSLGIGEIVITGGTSQLEGLGNALHQMIGVQVRVGDPLQRLTVRKAVESGFEQSLGSLAVPIGLAIDDDPIRTVDLTPRDTASHRRRVNVAPILIPVAAVVPLAALGLFFSQAHGKVTHRQSQLSSLQSTLASLPEPTEPQIDADVQGAEAARASAVAQVLGARTSWDGVLRDLSRVLPANVWLTGLQASVPAPLSTVVVATPAATGGSGSATASRPTASVTPTGVTITGYTFSHPDVAVLLGRLVALPSFANVQLVSATEATVGAKNVVQFTILANLRGVGGGA